MQSVPIATEASNLFLVHWQLIPRQEEPSAPQEFDVIAALSYEVGAALAVGSATMSCLHPLLGSLVS